jgi:hypothetical protein
MKDRFQPLTILFALFLSLTACSSQSQFYWGSYEESLFERHQQAGAAGETTALTMLGATISDAEAIGTHKVGPGIHADYGYLLYKQGKPDEAIVELQKEAALYPESSQLMNTMVSRIQGRKNKEKEEKKPTP